jgi:two-component system, NtrC family, nitrogen regulation sensor histidine kinase GlnL
MLVLEFCVDDQLRITGCGERACQTHAGSSGRLFGAPYTRLIPQLIHDRQDAVGWVLAKGEGLFLENVRLEWPHSALWADLTIEPIEKDGAVAGARIDIRAYDGCHPPGQTPRLQRSAEMDKLAIMLSHGVRNPLNAIKGAVTYLRSRFQSDPELDEFTGIMTEEIARLERFISGFLATSFHDHAPHPLDINDLLKKIVVYTSLQAQAAGVEITFDCAPVVPLQINAFQMEQAILNLLNNAIAVLPPGGWIRLSSGQVRRQEQLFVFVEVSDNGPGMPHEKVATLHDPHSEPERGRDRGFGLFITREVVHSCGGFLEVDSVVGSGTCIRLMLPAVEKAAAGEPGQ